MAQGADDIKRKEGGLFEGLSMAQVVAGALAAVTSMLLASQIGIAGSVIGVGVGSIVSAVASQMYKRFLMKSAEKLRDVLPGDAGVSSGDDAVDESAATRRLEGAAADVTCVDAAAIALDGKTRPFDAVTIRRSHTPRVDDDVLCEDVTVQRARALRARKKKVQRRVVAVSATSALVAVLISAVAVNFVTTGEGLGVKMPSFVASSGWNGSTDFDNASTSSGGSGSSDSGASTGSSADQSSSAGVPDDSSSGTQEGSQGSSGSDKPSDGTQGGDTPGGDQSNGSSGSTPPDAGGSTDGSGSSGTPDAGGSAGSGGGSTGSTGAGGGVSGSTGGSSGAAGGGSSSNTTTSLGTQGVAS